MKIFVISSIFLTIFFVPVFSQLVLNSPVVTEYGTWGTMVECGENEFINAVRIDIEPTPWGGQPPPQSDQPDITDNKGIVRIALECVNPYDTGLALRTIVTPAGKIYLL